MANPDFDTIQGCRNYKFELHKKMKKAMQEHDVKMLRQTRRNLAAVDRRIQQLLRQGVYR